MDSATTIIDAQADIEGTLRGKDAQVLGRFRGQIDPTVTADAVEIAGEYRGELKARSLAVLEKGRVEGTIDAQRLAMREGALLNGSVNAGDGRPAPRASMTGLATG